MFPHASPQSDGTRRCVPCTRTQESRDPAETICHQPSDWIKCNETFEPLSCKGKGQAGLELARPAGVSSRSRARDNVTCLAMAEVWHRRCPAAGWSAPGLSRGPPGVWRRRVPLLPTVDPIPTASPFSESEQLLSSQAPPVPSAASAFPSSPCTPGTAAPSAP